jgi:glycosyltransferase involved in cell wall biosynthesis
VIAQGVEAALSLDSIKGSRPIKQPYILVLSRFHPGKGLEVLLDAFLSLVKEAEFSEWQLVLAGDGPPEYIRKLKGKVSDLNYRASVSFPGWIEGAEKEAFLSNASLLALPSYHENFGLCVMEALSRGVPVLISPHVDLAPDVEAAGAGWIASVETAALRMTLAEALRSKGERIRRGKLGRTLSERFTWPIIAEQLTDLYTSVLNAS